MNPSVNKKLYIGFLLFDVLKQNSQWVVDLHEHLNCMKKSVWPVRHHVKFEIQPNSMIYVRAFRNCIEALLYDNEWCYCDSLYNVFVYMICAGTTEEDWSCFVFSVQALIKIGEVIHLTNWGYISIYMTRVRWDDVCEYEWFERWDGVFPADKLTESWNVKFFSVTLIYAVLCSVPIYPKQLVWISD